MTDLLMALSLIIPACRIPFITQAFSSRTVCSREKAEKYKIIQHYSSTTQFMYNV